MTRPFGEHLKSAAAYAFLFTIFMAGFGVAAAIWSSSLSPIQSELTRTRQQKDRTEAELNEVKADYSSYRARQAADSNTGIGHASPLSTSAGKQAETVTIEGGASADVFGGAVILSVIAIPFGGDPLRHTVIASVGAPGYPSITIDNKDVGFSIEFKGQKRFEIRVLAAEALAATFRVTVVDG